MKLWSIQILRFVAALLVVDFHARNMTFALTHDPGILGPAAVLFGKCGVDLFFVISGFIITRTSSGLSAGQFVVRRARRILPLYLMLAPFWIVWSAMSGLVGWRDLIATLGLWPLTDRLTAPLVPVAWTLCFEVLFYAAAALMIWRPRTIWLVGAVFLCALCLRSNPALKFLGNPIILEFVLGACLARLPLWRPAVLALPIGVALLVAGDVMGWPLRDTTQVHLDGSEGWTRLILLGVPAVLVVWGTLQLRLREGVLTYLGDTSYSLYLVHLPIVPVTVTLLARLTALPADLVIVAASGASVLAAWRVHELFEKPAIAWLKAQRWGARVSATA